MLVGLHTHYQMHLASKFTQFFMKFDSTQAFYLQIQSIFIKTNTFYKKLPIFIKNYIGHTYKKLQPQISAFIKNSIFGINRDPWFGACASASHSGSLYLVSMQLKHEKPCGDAVQCNIIQQLKSIPVYFKRVFSFPIQLYC